MHARGTRANSSVHGVPDRRSYGTREPQGACPGRFIIFFLFKCHFVACSAVYKTECVPRGSRVSYHLSSFVAYKHNSTRSLARFILCLRIRSDTWERGRSAAKIASASSIHGDRKRRARISVRGVPQASSRISDGISRPRQVSAQKCHPATRTGYRRTKTKECWDWRRWEKKKRRKNTRRHKIFFFSFSFHLFETAM